MLNNELNAGLQGKGKHEMDMISSVNTFKLLTRKLQRDFFQHMHSELQRQGKDTAQFDSGR
jgi:cyclopropane fatty-acyl-phospholipid synthase-like methyltransferase